MIEIYCQSMIAKKKVMMFQQEHRTFFLESAKVEEFCFSRRNIDWECGYRIS